ncbi:hypothetical protein M406DRAFT_333424 [Cryphonectria parasitica EP155]|uniref:Zn(2)-C6 fungal-type domain-containing protein n=1 Tax=Cryphonectria parasitica (strain ATCC 38755 / EP155) TaxID=660469 RepID=A0A9P4XUW6_CRYP1|nr:uncharacterized protein M406DRAFT_333424 [Cryphonectria parasitica EP155]KAF3761356.1 hypothetical protein M406DRAFT_333424 [Cryphonectria parasitica EP155]
MKRKPDASPDESSQKQQRSRRNRYISIACNECKRRKIKCNGETPCQRCGNLNLQCLYAPNCCSNSFKESDEFKHMNDTLNLLQEQMDTLQRKVSELQQETQRLAPLHDRVLPLPTAGTNVGPSPSTSTSSMHKADLPSFRPPLLFRGPTSASSHVNVAKATLQNMGYSGAEGSDDNAIILDDSPAQSPLPPTSQDVTRRLVDPLWDYDKDEMIRLCRLHEDEVGIMYPVVSINDVIAHAHIIADWMESTRKQGAGQFEGFNDIKTLELKIIMCCALVVEENGYSAKATRLWSSIQPIADRLLMSDPSDVAKLPFLALVGGFRFLENEEVLAWRVMGQVARLCLEMGLHRRDGIAKIAGAKDRRNAINTFWSAYVLDRRWSFGTGFPFVVHDDKIDPHLPWPEDYPYLTSLIAFAKLSSKIWRLVDYFDDVLIRDLKREDFQKMDEEILEWYETVPEQIKIRSLGNLIPVPGSEAYNVERLQIWTRLRLNQIRIWLYTPVLHTASSISQNRDFAQRVVDLAKETIQFLTMLNNNSIVYNRIQVFYHHFLTSSIAVLFLASTHAPVAFSSQCRQEFHMALELVKDLSSKSWVSQRLWRTVKSLKAYAPRLGLQQDEDPKRPENGSSMMSGMAYGGHNQIGISSTSHRSSVSSAGPQSTSSPGLTPNYGQQQSASRMGSLTPHNGRNPLRSAGGQMQNPGHPVSQPEDPDNGLRLQTEMSRIFEGFANSTAHNGQLAEADDFLSSHMGVFSANGGPLGMAGDNDGVYQHMKEMF